MGYDRSREHGLRVIEQGDFASRLSETTEWSLERFLSLSARYLTHSLSVLSSTYSTSGSVLGETSVRLTHRQLRIPSARFGLGGDRSAQSNTVYLENRSQPECAYQTDVRSSPTLIRHPSSSRSSRRSAPRFDSPTPTPPPGNVQKTEPSSCDSLTSKTRSEAVMSALAPRLRRLDVSTDAAAELDISAYSRRLRHKYTVSTPRQHSLLP